MRVLLTGSSGFVGSAVYAEIQRRGIAVRPVFRRAEFGGCSGCVEPGAVFVQSIEAETDWKAALAGVEQVIHCAAKVHVLNDSAADSLDEFRKVNVDGTLNLARQAAQAGIKRFVFVSSIGVNGAETLGTPFSEQDLPAPHSPYAVSKYEAEAGLKTLAAQTGMEVVNIRPPLVYGPEAPGNFGLLMRWLERGVPLPLGAVHNKRSFVALDNLVDLILRCVSHPAAANQTFMVSDGEDLSTTDLLRRIARAMNRPSRLIPVPVMLLQIGAALLGKSGIAQSLCGSLQVDISKTRKLLDWAPLVSIDEGLRRAVRKQV